jgi:hypothetical protein
VHLGFDFVPPVGGLNLKIMWNPPKAALLQFHMLESIAYNRKPIDLSKTTASGAESAVRVARYLELGLAQRV